MLETKTKEIGACSYSVQQLGALKGHQVLMRLLKCIGPALEGLEGKKLSEEVLAGMLAKVVSELDEGAVDYFCDAFAGSTTVLMPDGKAPFLNHVFDVHFAGKYLDLAKWLVFCMEVNFGDFFGEALKSAAKKSALPAKKKSG